MDIWNSGIDRKTGRKRCRNDGSSGAISRKGGNKGKGGRRAESNGRLGQGGAPTRSLPTHPNPIHLGGVGFEGRGGKTSQSP